MNNILETICTNKRHEVAEQKRITGIEQLKEQLQATSRKKISFRQALETSATGIIAEFKRKSPSKGWIHRDADIEQVVRGYEAGGASAVSCLTDEKFFGGSFSDFEKARSALTRIPLLRKDFIVDEYQLYQSKALGADAVLLIAACLSRDEVQRFVDLAHELDMETLLEIHSESELSHIPPVADVIGINNRDLKTFITDISHTVRLSRLIPAEFVKISESGLSSPDTVIALRREGFRGFLMGENFMKTARPERTLIEFIKMIA
ncbi:MAG: indole-3-glycerol phosphate synthase TrpC [Bacteroidales bacterium]|nr:indole-3-glycerol phosphate synthase TrpC [Bacteroidales bacterium]